MIIIPDIHGRDFWEEAADKYQYEDFVFLGDYVDPYTEAELIPSWAGIKALKDVIDFKKKYPDRVTLLLGNHDLSYLSDLMPSCRFDYERGIEIYDLLRENTDLFKIAHTKQIGKKTYLFTHAGILRNWVEKNRGLFPSVDSIADMDKRFSELFDTTDELFMALRQCSYCRGGDDPYGSCVWADIREHLFEMEKKVPDKDKNVYQVFGHTKMLTPMITSRFACLDCQRPVMLDDENGNFKVL